MAKNNSPGLAWRESVLKPLTNDAGDPCSNSPSQAVKIKFRFRAYTFHFRANLAGSCLRGRQLDRIGEQEHLSRNGARQLGRSLGPGPLTADRSGKPLGVARAFPGRFVLVVAQRRDKHPM